MNNFELTIGIEVHTELNTKSKMFSSSPVSSYDEVNTNINEIDLGLPGILPSPNKEAVIRGIKLANALHMQVEPILCFDRKNYFYQDLPKGFQITQQYYPIGKNGNIKISNKTINIERIHLEEDTAKQQTIDNKVFLDYNRCGVPLIEIVSKPDIKSSKEAVEYLNELKRILIFLNISDGKMEDGSFRADVNISVAPYGSKTLGTKVEIKNLNSFEAVAKAIDFEFNRQSRLLVQGIKVDQETRRWDDVKLQTIFMRTKIDAIDYHYFREPNIVQIDISNLIKETLKNKILTPTDIKNELLAMNIANNYIEQLLDNYQAYLCFQQINNVIKQPNLVITWVLVELASYLKKVKKNYSDITKEQVNKIIDLLTCLIKEEINGKQAKTIFELMLDSNKSVANIINENGFKQITDEKVIKDYFVQYIEQNKQMADQYKERPERIEKFFVGLLMRDTKGQANPNVAIKILKELLSSR